MKRNIAPISENRIWTICLDKGCRFENPKRVPLTKTLTCRWSDIQLQEYTDYNSKGTHSAANSKEDNNASFWPSNVLSISYRATFMSLPPFVQIKLLPHQAIKDAVVMSRCIIMSLEVARRHWGLVMGLIKSHD